MNHRCDTVIFDLGGVVIGWDPYRAYENLLDADATRAWFERSDFRTWNLAVDAGQRFAEAEAQLIERFPDDRETILAYRQNFARTLTGMVPGTSAIIAELQQAEIDLVGLTNWSDELFPIAQQRFGILNRLRGIVVSGAEGVAKPDPAIFALCCERFDLDPARTVFVDDSTPNVEAAQAFGLAAIQFTDADAVRAELVRLRLLGSPSRPSGPAFHLAVRDRWEAADYPWSSRESGYDAEGFVHCSYGSQLAGTRQRFYADLADAELVLLRLRDDAWPIVVESGFPHLYAPLTRDLVAAELDPGSTFT